MKYKYHFVYKTINLINGKYYIGKHSTNNLNDVYLGSGKALMKALKKYDNKNFKRIILFMAKSSDIAYLIESWFIDEKVLLDKNSYNMKLGGLGGNNGMSKEARQKISIYRKGKRHSNETKNKISLANKNPSKEVRRKISENNKGRIVSEDTRKKVSKSMSNFYKINPSPFLGKKHSLETIEKIKEANKKRKREPLSEEVRKKIGEINKGTVYIHNLEEMKCKRVLKEELNNWINNGWIKGRKIF